MHETITLGTLVLHTSDSYGDERTVVLALCEGGVDKNARLVRGFVTSREMAAAKDPKLQFAHVVGDLAHRLMVDTLWQPEEGKDEE